MPPNGAEKAGVECCEVLKCGDRGTPRRRVPDAAIVVEEGLLSSAGEVEDAACDMIEACEGGSEVCDVTEDLGRCLWMAPIWGE